jgi:hypothetical protein
MDDAGQENVVRQISTGLRNGINVKTMKYAQENCAVGQGGSR